MEKIKYVYIGQDPEVPLILSKDNNFKIIAVALDSNFFKKTVNPFNFIFKAIFFLRRKEISNWLESFLIFLWKIVKPLSTSIFFKFRNYLTFISENNVHILDLESFKEAENYIKTNNTDLIIVNIWDLLIGEILNLPKYGTINIHPSKLPKYRGSLPTLWALKNGDEESAVSYILLNSSIDGGKILAQHNFIINKDDNSITLEYKIKDILNKTLAGDLKKYIKGKLIPIFQNEKEASNTGKYYGYLKINLFLEKGKDIYNKILLYPYIEPSLYCYFIFNNNKIFIKNAKFKPLGNNLDGNKAGSYKVQGLIVEFYTFDGIIKARLFLDLGFIDSLKLLFKKQK